MLIPPVKSWLDLWLHKGFSSKNNEIRKNMLFNFGSKHDSASNGRSVTTLDKLKSCCHHSLRDLFVHTDGALLEIEKNIAPMITWITIQMDVSFV